MDSKQQYAGNNHVSGEICGNRFHLSIGNEPVLLKHGCNSWLTEWHYYFGPSVVGKRDHNPLEKQPGERSYFWKIAQWWHDQGCEVKDGVGIWKEPEIVETRWTSVGRMLVQDENGKIVRRHWKGYEQFGEAKPGMP